MLITRHVAENRKILQTDADHYNCHWFSRRTLPLVKFRSADLNGTREDYGPKPLLSLSTDSPQMAPIVYLDASRICQVVQS